MKGKFRILRRIGLGVLLVCALMVAFMPVAPVVSAATAVTEVNVDFPYEDAKNTYESTSNTYIVCFKPTTAIERGVDYVTVTFPDGSEAMGGDGNTAGNYVFTIGSAPAASTIDFSTDYDTTDLVEGVHWYDVTITPTVGGNRMKVLSPIDIAAGQDVWVRFVCGSAITAATAEVSTYKVYVSTTKDTTPVLSSTFALGNSTSVAGQTAMVSGYPLPATAGATATYIFTFVPANGTTLTASTGKVTVKFPMQATVPSSLSLTDVSFSTDGTAYTSTPETPTVNVNTREVTAITSLTMTGNGSADWYIKIDGITNPTIADSSNYKYMVRTSGDGIWECSAADAITATSLNKVIVANGEIGTPTSIWSDDATMVDMYSSQIYLALGDQYGNAKAPESGVTVTLSSSSGTGAFYWNNGEQDMATGTPTSCTSVSVSVQDPNNTDSEEGDQIVYYKDSTAGTHTLTFRATDYTDAEWTFSVVPGVSVYDSADNLVSTYKPLSTSPSAETGDDSPTPGPKYSVDYINDAISGAMTGDTVKLGDGIYELDAVITLDEKITLTSVNGASSTTLRGTESSLARAINITTQGTATAPIIIDGLTFERWRYGREIRECIHSDGFNYVTVRNCVFNDIMPNELMDDKRGVVSLFGGDQCTIDSMVISNNTFTNCCTYPWPKLSTEVYELTSVINVQAKEGCTLNGLSITGNTLTNCDGYDISVKGTAASLVTGSITDNTLTDCYWAICLGDHWNTSGFSITGNTITGAYEYGIEIEGDAAGDLTIKNNTITGSALVRTNSAIHLAGKSSGAYCYYVQYNDIYDNASGTDAIEIGTTSSVAITDINCNYNYYGDASGPYYSALTGATVAKSNPNGTGASISDAVFYYPWLHKPVTDVVADNVSWQTSNMKLVLGGWNTLSTPVPLIESADTIDELISEDDMEIGYYYDGGWTQITTGYVLSPCDAVYVKMKSTASTAYVQLKFECETFSTPSKDLAVGWNLISLAALDSDGMQGDDAVASVYKTAGNLPGYGQVISPSLNTTRCDMYYNTGTSWVVSCAEHGDDLTTKLMYAGMGYWIYMQNAATLAGLEITPIAPDLD